MATKKTKTEQWPKVTKGTHLTVTTHEDGRTELEWDDEQLLKEVREATSVVVETKPKRSKKVVS
jgi:YD repeat-containing protein